jgi:iron complex outermembrane receptor protein
MTLGLNKISRNLLIAGWMIGAGMLLAGVASAQTAPAAAQAAPASAPASDSSPGDIVVTAQKRTERLQDVPVSVAVVSASRLQQAHITSVEGLTELSPSLSFTDSANTRGQGLTIRGVGTLSFSDGVEPDVSTVIDGVVLGRQAMTVFDLIDVDQVEVLRGPQGTLFGKNSSAGVLSITTAAPSNTFGGQYSATYETLNEVKLQGSVTGPIVNDVLDGRLTGYYTHGDGWITNVFDGDKLNGDNQWGLRGKLLFTPTSTLDLTLIADYESIYENCCAPTIRSAPAGTSYFGVPYATLIGVTPGPYNQSVDVDGPYYLNQNSEGVSLQADQQLGWATLTSITAYRAFNDKDGNDADLTPIDIFDVNNANQKQSQFTQELRLASPAGRKLEYVAGLYYFYQDLTTTTRAAGNLGAVPSPEYLGSTVNRGITTNNEAVFGQATWHVTDQFSLIAGGRYTAEQLRAFFDRSTLPGAVAATPASIAGPPLTANNLGTNETNFSYKFGAQYAFDSDLMFYATYSKGFKGAALNMLNFLPASLVANGQYVIPPELSSSYEVGLRSSMLNRRLQVNLTGFLTDFTGFQATAYDPTINANTLVSAGGLRTQGVELEVIATPAHGLTLNGNLAYTDARFTSFPNGPCYPGEALLANSPCHLSGTIYVQNLKGAPLNNAPKLSFNVGGSYIHPLPMADTFDGFIDVNYAYRSDANFSLSEDPNTIQKAYGLLNLNLGVQPHGGLWRVSLFAKNLLDQHYASLIFSSSFQGGSALAKAGYSQFIPEDARRIIGVSLDGKF